MAISKEQAREKLKDAKDLFDAGIIDESKYNQVKNECLPVLGIPTKQTPPVIQTTSSTTLDPQPLIALLRQYQSRKNGTWSAQQKELLLGYLFDYRPPTMKVRHLEKFITVSYTDKLLAHLEQPNQPFVAQTVLTLTSLYNADFIHYCTAVWAEVLGVHVPFISRATTPGKSTNKRLQTNPPVIESDRTIRQTSRNLSAEKDRDWQRDKARMLHK